jgi:hypothetical protein
MNFIRITAPKAQDTKPELIKIGRKTEDINMRRNLSAGVNVQQKY